MRGPPALVSLIRCASTSQRPLNSQDAVLILRALYHLRYRSDAVRGVCVRCASAITTARITLPVERVVDALHALVSLQATSLPVVHDTLSDRLLELNNHTASPRAVQKAAVVVMKLGRRHCKPRVAVHVFDVLSALVESHPSDVALRLSIVSVFPYTTTSTSVLAEDQERINTFRKAVEYLVNAHILSTLRGNSALQAMHAMIILDQSPLNINKNSNNKRSSSASGKGGNGAEGGCWEKARRTFREELQLTTVVPGGYAQFLYDFLPDLALGELHGGSGATMCLSILQSENFCRSLNVYDIAKIGGAISKAVDTLATTSPAPPLTTALSFALVELVNRLDSIHSSETGSDMRLDVGAIGALWRAAQRCACAPEWAWGSSSESRITNAIQRLAVHTQCHVTRLSSATSWIMYSMCLCERSSIGAAAEGLDCAIDAVAFALSSAKVDTLPFRSCVQALFAASNLKSQRPWHDALQRNMLCRLLSSRYRDYPANDVPMMLRALANLSSTTGAAMSEEAIEMTSRTLRYIAGLRDAEWHQRYGVNVACSTLALTAAAPPVDPPLCVSLESQLRALRSREIGFPAVSRLLAAAVAAPAPPWAREAVLALAAQRTSCLSSNGAGGGGVRHALEAAEHAQQLGAAVSFDGAELAHGIALRLDAGALAPVDAAQALRLMSHELQCGRPLRAADALPVELCRIATGGGGERQVQTLLHLLRASVHPGASRQLFDATAMEAMLAAVHRQLKERQHLWGEKPLQSQAELREAGRIVHAFLTSQVLVRLKKPLRDCEGLREMVVEVLDTLEANRIEKLDTLFQMRLLCDG